MTTPCAHATLLAQSWRGAGTYRGALADEATAGVAGNSTGPPIPAGFAFAAVHHGVTATACEGEERVRSRGRRAGMPGGAGGLQAGGRGDAVLTCIARSALAFVVVDPLHAVLGAAGVAGVGQALVDISLAALPYKARGADAAVATYPILALAIVKALGPQGDRIKERAAVIHIDLTVHP